MIIVFCFTLWTEYAGHAKEIGLNLDVEQWDGIVICSGDGLVYEVSYVYHLAHQQHVSSEWSTVGSGDIFMLCSQSTDYGPRSVSENNYFLPCPNLEYLKKSFGYKGELVWNQLPTYIENSLPSFKTALDNHLL